MKKYLTLFNSHAEYEQYVSGDFEKPNVSHCVQEDDVHYNPRTWADEYLTFVARENGTFTFTPYNTNAISYSTDNGKTWTQENSVNVNNGDRILWKGTMRSSGTNHGIGIFSSTGNFDVEGNIMSLLFSDNYKGQTSLSAIIFVFYQLFYQNIKLINAENLSLPATTLVQSCYREMFKGCTALTTAPKLPATVLTNYCYSYMFQNCTALTTAPELSSETLTERCYRGMFDGCTALTSAPKLPATTLANQCYYQMFNGCTALTSAPALPATTLADSCYSGMFQGCTSLTTAPVLPATTLVNSCYQAMFYNCTNLNYIKAMFTTTPSNSYTGQWVQNVASSGTFVKNSAAQWDVSGVHGVPTGWTVQIASA